MPSHYANTPTIYIDRGSKFCKSFKSFINNINRIDKFYEKNLINAHVRYKYFQLLQLIIEIFSEKNVKIFLLEDCEKNSNAFFNEICLFMKKENYHEINSKFPVNVTKKKGKGKSLKELINIFLAKIEYFIIFLNYYQNL